MGPVPDLSVPAVEMRPLTQIEEAWWPVLVLWYSLVLVPSGPDPTSWGSSALAHLAELSGEG